MTVQDEARFESSIRDLGQEWVRIRPPTMEEAKDFAKDPRCIKFIRVGTIAVITEETSNHVEISCADDRILYSREEFKETWMPLVSQDSWRQSDRIVIRSD